MGKKIVFITTRLFWPPDSGRKVSLYHYCKGLHEQLGYEVHVYAFLEGDQGADDAANHPGFIEGVRVAAPVPAGTKAKNLALAAFRPSEPLQCALYWSRANCEAIRDYCEEVGPDAVLIDMVRLAPYMEALEGLGCATVLDYDDLLSKRYERQMGEGGSVLGKYGTQASGLVSLLASSRLVKRALLSVESRRVRRAEDEFARAAGAVLFVSPLEASELDARLGTAKCFDATLGADVPDPPDYMPRQEYDFGFVGNMHTAANQASLDFICGEVLPLLPGRTLRVIGVCPDNVARRYEQLSRASFSGRVESIADELLKCKVMLAPFAYGTGIKTKVLEAMGMGVPVVTNSIGIEGMTCWPGTDLLVGESARELAGCCNTLLASPEKRSEVGKAGREYVRRCHDWGASIDNLGRCLEFAAAHRAGGGAR